MKTIDLARELFEAYNEQGPNPWKTHSGAPVPKWNELGDQVQGKWHAAAIAAVKAVARVKAGIA